MVVCVQCILSCGAAAQTGSSCWTTVSCSQYSNIAACIPQLPLGATNCYGVPYEWTAICEIPNASCPPPDAAPETCPACAAAAAAAQAAASPTASVPISLASGNTYIQEHDIRIAGLSGGLNLLRTWNSLWPATQSAYQIGMFGPNWRSTYEERVFLGADNYMKYGRSDGSFWSFGYNGGNYSVAAPANLSAGLAPGSSYWTITFQSGEQRLFDNSTGHLISIIDRNGNTTSLSYDTSGRLVTVIDPASRHLYFSYGSGGASYLVSGVSSDVGISTSYSYDSLGRLSQVTEQDSSTLSFTYNSQSLITLVADSMGHTLSHKLPHQRQGIDGFPSQRNQCRDGLLLTRSTEKRIVSSPKFSARGAGAMRLGKLRLLAVAALLLLSVLICGRSQAQSPTVTGLAPVSGPVGTAVTITGTDFGTTQGSSTVALAGTTATVLNWSDTSIVASVPTGASSGTFSVTIGGTPATSSSFTVTLLPSGWSDADIGSVGVAGSSSYANGVFTQNGAGSGTFSTATDGINFQYQSLTGDAAIIARVVSVPSGTATQAGLMIRESLDPGATSMYVFDYSSAIWTTERASTGTSTSYSYWGSISLPYWIELTRNGDTFIESRSPDGINWTEVGTQTIAMAQNIYIGLAVSSRDTSSLSTVTFDNASVSTPSSLPPSITSLSATTGPVGTQVVISGFGFGASQSYSQVTVNGVVASVSSWTDASITITVPSAATTGPVQVSVAPSMNDSNCVTFTVTSQPLPSGWLDEDIGSVGLAGSATYSGGSFTVNAAGSGTYFATTDQIHFVYQPLSGDGTIIARVATVPSGSDAQVGVMIRETLAPGANHIYAFERASEIWTTERTTTNASTSYGSFMSATLPYWIEIIRSGNIFTESASLDGVNWVQLGTSQTITMAPNVYIGLAVSSRSTSTLATVTFDNVSISTSSIPSPVITSLSTTTGTVGSTVVILGSGFGISQGSSSATLSGTALTINSWNNTSISATIPSGATTGPLEVSVAPDMNVSNYVTFTVTTDPLPSGWLDQDIGPVAIAGSATYSSGSFTMNASGAGTIGETADQMHFVYQPLYGDGSIVARVVSVPSGTATQAGIMIRETLSANARRPPPPTIRALCLS